MNKNEHKEQALKFLLDNQNKVMHSDSIHTFVGRAFPAEPGKIPYPSGIMDREVHTMREIAEYAAKRLAKAEAAMVRMKQPFRDPLVAGMDWQQFAECIKGCVEMHIAQREKDERDRELAKRITSLERVVNPPQRCTCGVPTTLGTVHRTDGPCFVYLEPVRYKYDVTMEELDKENKQLRDGRDVDARTINRLDDERCKLQREVVDLRNEVRRLHGQLTTVVCQRDEAARNYDNLGKQLSMIVKQRDDLTMERDSQANELAQLRRYTDDILNTVQLERVTDAWEPGTYILAAVPAIIRDLVRQRTEARQAAGGWDACEIKNLQQQLDNKHRQFVERVNEIQKLEEERAKVWAILYNSAMAPPSGGMVDGVKLMALTLKGIEDQFKAVVEQRTKELAEIKQLNERNGNLLRSIEDYRNGMPPSPLLDRAQKLTGMGEQSRKNSGLGKHLLEVACDEIEALRNKIKSAKEKL